MLKIVLMKCWDLFEDTSPQPIIQLHIMAFAAARIIKDKKDQQEQKLIRSPECVNVNRTGKKVFR